MALSSSSKSTKAAKLLFGFRNFSCFFSASSRLQEVTKRLQEVIIIRRANNKCDQAVFSWAKQEKTGISHAASSRTTQMSDSWSRKALSSWVAAGTEFSFLESKTLTSSMTGQETMTWLVVLFCFFKLMTGYNTTLGVVALRKRYFILSSYLNT